MAHENKHDVALGTHEYVNGEYKKKEYVFQEFPKYADDGETILANAKEEKAYFDKKKKAVKLPSEKEKESDLVPIVE